MYHSWHISEKTSLWMRHFVSALKVKDCKMVFESREPGRVFGALNGKRNCI